MNNKKKHPWKKLLMTVVIGAFIFPLVGGIAMADSGGFSDESTGGGDAAYSRHALDNYQLDFYVNMSGSWLPWNWSSGIAKGIDTALYKITDGIWWLTRTLANGTGFLVQEAFNFDFIGQTANTIGENIQTLAGIGPNGFTGGGFYDGLLIFVVLLLGIYIAYVGGIKHEVSKALNTALSTLIIFIVTTGLIAYAPSMIQRVNTFSSEMSTYTLSMGLDMMGAETGGGDDSVDTVRSSVFVILVEKPWMLLQYGTTDTGAIENGAERIDKLLSTDPDLNSGEDRENVVSEEVTMYHNQYMSINKTASRLGSVLLVLVVDIVISIFILLLCGLMIFSQVLFIIYVMMLPISWVLSMIPSFGGMFRRSIERLFNIVLLRVGYTLIITIAFSLSSLLYSLSGTMPFLFVAFLQIICFAGIYLSHNQLLNMMSLQSNENQSLMRRMRMGARRTTIKARGLQRSVGREAGKVRRGISSVLPFATSGRAGAHASSSGASTNAKTANNKNANASGGNSPGDKNTSSRTGPAAQNTTRKGQSDVKPGSPATKRKGENGSPLMEKMINKDVRLGNMPGAVRSSNSGKLYRVTGQETGPGHTPAKGRVSENNARVVMPQKPTAPAGSKKDDRTPIPPKAEGVSNKAPNNPASVTHTRLQDNSVPAARSKAASNTHSPVQSTGLYKMNGKPYTKEQIENFSGIDTDDKKGQDRWPRKGRNGR